MKAGDDADTTNYSATPTHSATSTDTDYQGITIGSVAMMVNDNDTANTQMEFSAPTATGSVTENTPPGQNVGVALVATDADMDTLAYALEGTDAAFFAIVSASGQILTKTGVAYNYEAKSSYSFTVKADDNNGGTDTIVVMINVTDVDEPPVAPGAHGVADCRTSH